MKAKQNLRTDLESILAKLDEAEEQASQALDDQPLDIDGHIAATLEAIGDARAKLDAVLLDHDLQSEGESALAAIPGNFHVLRP